MSTPSRLTTEAEFHDARAEDDFRTPTGKYYEAASNGRAYFNRLVRERSKHQDVLDLGCGTGENSVAILAANPSSLVSVDISSGALIKLQNELPADDAHVGLSVMDAHRLAFRDNAFDLVAGVAILHHLDLEVVANEVARVLRPGGSAVFYEPMGHNPAINLYRAATPSMRTPDERPLRMRDISTVSAPFDSCDLHFDGLLALAAGPFANSRVGRRAAHHLRRLDDHLLARSALARRLSWTVVMDLRAN